MGIRDFAALISAKLVFNLVTRLGGAGGTWPGEIALRIQPDFLRQLNIIGRKVIFVTGTNGKTTTVKMLATILGNLGYKVNTNKTGANLVNGLVSAFTRDMSWSGVLRSTYYIFEVDEANLTVALNGIRPDMIILLNLFRDQLDRYGEVDKIAQDWLKVLSTIPGRDRNKVKLLINGDDPQLAQIGQVSGLNTQYFGLDNDRILKKGLQHANDSIYCPRCGERLDYRGYYYSHLGKYRCKNCNFCQPQMDLVASDINPPLPGTYNVYNSLAASLAARQFCPDQEKIQSGLSGFLPAFGRQEEVTYKNRKFKILLSKNPTGFNESLTTALALKKSGIMLLSLNDNIADGRDVSWIWDVDFEVLSLFKGEIIVTGTRADDLSVRIKHALNADKKANDKMWRLPIVENDYNRAVEKCIGRSAESDLIFVLPTYTAMLSLRQILSGRKIL